MKDPNSENKIAPTNIEAEEAILGGILLDPDAFNRVKSDLTPAMFSLRSHQLIYRAFIELDNAQKVTDLMNVSEFLSSRNILDTVGGMAKLSQLLNRTVSAVNIDRYAQLVIDKWKRRELITLGQKLLDLGYRTELELPELIKSVDQMVTAWLGSTERTNLIGKMSYTAVAKQENKHYEETIKLEAEIDLNSDPNIQIKKLQAQADQLFKK